MRFVSLVCGASMALASVAFAGGGGDAAAANSHVGGTRQHRLHCNVGRVGVGYNLMVETIAGVAPWYSVKSCTLLKGIPGSEPNAIAFQQTSDVGSVPSVFTSEDGEFQVVVQPSGNEATLKFGNGAYPCASAQ
jgi:hypothetical protein